MNKRSSDLKNWSVRQFTSIESTNDYLLKHSSEYPDKTVIVADTQTAGKGRNGKSWVSPRGGLYASILFKPAPGAVISLGVSLLFADIIRGNLSRSGIAAEIKWPNDVLVDERKIAGILPEYTSLPEPILVIGFGVNLDISPVPRRYGLLSASWKEFGTPPAAKELLGDLLIDLDNRWSDRNANPLSSPVELEKHLWKFGENVTLLHGEKTVDGMFAGITAEGYLRLQKDGEEKIINSGSILTRGIMESEDIYGG